MLSTYLLLLEAGSSLFWHLLLVPFKLSFLIPFFKNWCLIIFKNQKDWFAKTENDLLLKTNLFTEVDNAVWDDKDMLITKTFKELTETVEAVQMIRSREMRKYQASVLYPLIDVVSLPTSFRLLSIEANGDFEFRALTRAWQPTLAGRSFVGWLKD